jgi:peptide-methionine (S)-S-oxide reductase
VIQSCQETTVPRFKQLLLTLACSLLLFGCSNAQSLADNSTAPASPTTPIANPSTAIFAGGCFWCMEKPFDELPGVIATTSGYTGGTKVNPTYREVSSGNTGHTEAVQVTYDPKQVTYDKLLSVFWKNIDPLDAQGQFCDKGSQYRSAIFYADNTQKQLAETSKTEIQTAKKFTQPIATEVTQAGTFYPAEDYHQNYYKTNAVKYKFYRYSCGRDQRLNAVWGETLNPK